MNKYEIKNQEALKKISEGKRVPLMKIIRLKCLECTNWQSREVKLCPIKDCILYAYRSGKNPFPKKLNDNQLKALQNGRDKQR